MKKKVTAIILCMAMLFSVCSVTASAASAENTLMRIADKAVNALAGGIASIIRCPDWAKQGEEDTEGFMPGMAASEFIDSPAQNAAWSVGYSSRTLQTGDELDGKHFVGGSLSFPQKKVATEVRDDQRVRTAAISDGRNIAVFASLDAYGLSNPDVCSIRSEISEYSKKNGIVSINISSLHQHSCVDTFGMNGDLIKALFVAPIRSLFGLKNESGQNPEYMKNLKEQVIASIKEAVADMKTGSLYYGTVNAEDFIRDKRDPQVLDKNLNRLRFVPDDGSEETWLVNAAIHCVGNGAAGTIVTGDYPYYMEKYITETTGANLVYIQGAELAITSMDGDIKARQEDIDKYGERYAGLMAYGKRLGELLCSITANDEQRVSPILNIAHKQFYVPIENNILLLAGKCGLLTNRVVRSGLCSYSVSTELGYVELGSTLAFAVIPGELAAEIAYGGAIPAEESWTNTSWDYPSMQQLSEGRKLLVLGITNDQIGYILTDNSWHSLFTENEEISSTGSKAGSTVISEYKSFVESLNP